MSDTPERQHGELRPALERAHRALEQALDEACDSDHREADTGELIRIDESLAAASKAAKDAVSLRLKMRAERQRPSPNSASSRAQRVEHDEHRLFDIGETRWAVFAVYPSDRTVEHAALPEAFRKGWLSFEHGEEVRRYAPVPPDWEKLPDEELRRLCHIAEPKKRITSIRNGGGSA